MSNIQSKKFRRQNANVVMTKQRRPTSSTHKFFLALNLHRKSFPQDKLITFLNILNLQMKAKSVFFPKRLHSTEHILICIFFQTRHNRLFWSASKSVYFDCVLLLPFLRGGDGPTKITYLFERLRSGCSLWKSCASSRPKCQWSFRI